MNPSPFERGRRIARQRRSLGIAAAGLSWLLLAACRSAAPPVPPATAIAPPATATSAPTAAALPAAAANTVFPPIVAPRDNPSTPEKVELGRQLFFDPALSANGAMSCATCHVPEKGFSNGAAVSTARPGAPPRNVPSLWNVAFNRQLTWDGHQESLEAQAIDPLTLPHEMAATPAEVEARLRGMPAYVALFEAAFGGQGEQAVTFDHVTRALAAFQRTLLSQHSAFDRYVAGDASALTAQEQRGMALFFSAETHCAECHQPPTFSHETFRVIGVPSEDLGRAGVSANGVRGAFKVPTLRNVALTAPYMHNGSLATLEDVVQFYAGGAGRANDFPGVDPLLKGFAMTPDQQADLVAFLRALTDQSALPARPEKPLSEGGK